MSAQSFAPGKWIVRNGQDFVVAKLLPERRVWLENADSHEPVIVGVDTLINEVFAGTLVFLPYGRPRQEKNSDDKKLKVVDPSDMPPHIIAIGEFRLAVISPLVGKIGRTMSDVNARVAEINTGIEDGRVEAPVKSISAVTLYRWLAAYEKSGKDKRVLYPEFSKRGGGGKDRIPPETNYVLMSVIEDLYKHKEKKTLRDVYDETAVRLQNENALRTAGQFLELPGASTVLRRVNRLDMRERFELRHGKRAANRQFSQASTGPMAELPNDAWEIDSTPIDLVIVDDIDNLPLGRCTLTDIVDRSLRYPCGYYLGFEPPSYYSVMEAMYHAIRPKQDIKQKYGLKHDWLSCGVPGSLITDNGKEFIGQDLTDACESLNINLLQMPVKTPEYKGRVERLFRTESFMLHGLPGTTFSNPQERQDYDTMGQACILLSEVDKILTTFFIDIYAESEHKGLKGVPARRLETAIKNGFVPRLPSNIADLEILLGQMEFRTIQRHGIELNNLLYNDSSLAKLRVQLGSGNPVKLKFHPGDLSKIYVYDPFDKVYLTISVIEKYREYAQSLSLWKHRVITKFLDLNSDKSDHVQLGLAKRQIQDVVNMARGRRKGASKSFGRWVHGGKPQAAPANVPPPLPSPASQQVQGTTNTVALQAPQQPIDDGFSIIVINNQPVPLSLPQPSTQPTSRPDDDGWGVIEVQTR